MCELFGISSKEEAGVNDYLNEFFSHSSEHPHGWGIARLDGMEVSIEKEPVQASKSQHLKDRLFMPIRVKTAFAHIRKATIGNLDYHNCHPYTMKDMCGRQWTLIHNGTIFNYPLLDAYKAVQKGNTDSERILLYIVDMVNQAERELQRDLDAKERFDILDSLIVKMSKENKLNLMLYDGEMFYVHTNYRNSLYQLQKESQIIFSTTPLSQEDWSPVLFTTLLAYQEGKKVFQGTEHGNEYIESEENIKFLNEAAKKNAYN